MDAGRGGLLRPGEHLSFFLHAPKEETLGLPQTLLLEKESTLEQLCFLFHICCSLRSVISSR